MAQDQLRSMSKLDAARMFAYIHKMLVVSVFVYAVTGELFPVRIPIRNTMVVMLALLVMAIATVGVVLIIKSRLVDAAAQVLRTEPDDADAMNRWRAGQLAALVMSEAVALYGFILRMTGGSLNYAAPLYLVGLILLLVVRPSRP